MVCDFAPTTPKGCVVTTEDNDSGRGLGDYNEANYNTDARSKSQVSVDPCTVEKYFP